MTRSERNQLVVDNDRLAGWYVRRYSLISTRNSVYDDLVQAARVGLVEAAKRYDPARGQFSTYAIWWMARFVNEAKRGAFVIRTRKSTREIAAPTLVDEAMLEQQATDEKDIDSAIDARKIRQVLDELGERERALIEQRWLTVDPVTLREFGQRQGCTREGARYIEERAFTKLRHLLGLRLSRAAWRRRKAFVATRRQRLQSSSGQSVTVPA